MSTWHEELASLVEETGIVYTQEGFGKSDNPGRGTAYVADAGAGKLDEEGLKGFVKACGELLLELGKGFMDIAKQYLLTEDSYIVQKLSGKWDKFSGKFGYLNDYFLPEDRNPVHAWSVVLFVAILMFSGIPGIAPALLEEFGIRLVTYDLPGFGESDPHPSRNLNSSALDMLSLAKGVGITEKFWVLGYSSGSMYAWAALKYISDQIAAHMNLA